MHACLRTCRLKRLCLLHFEVDPLHSSEKFVINLGSLGTFEKRCEGRNQVGSKKRGGVVLHFIMLILIVCMCKNELFAFVLMIFVTVFSL